MSRPRTISDEQILEATRAAVRRHGPAVPLEAIARRLHVSQPALLKRFGTRHKLFLAALKPPETPPFLARLEAGPDTRPVEAQLVELLSEMAAYFDEIAPLISALRESGVKYDHVRAKRAHLAPLKALTGWIERGERMGVLHADDPEALAMVLLASVLTPAMMTHHLGKRAWKRDARQMVAPLSSLWAKALEPVARTA